MTKHDLERQKYKGDLEYRLQRTKTPCTRCVSHTGYLAHGMSKSESGSIKHQNYSRKGEIN